MDSLTRFIALNNNYKQCNKIPSVLAQARARKCPLVIQGDLFATAMPTNYDILMMKENIKIILSSLFDKQGSSYKLKEDIIYMQGTYESLMLKFIETIETLNIIDVDESNPNNPEYGSFLYGLMNSQIDTLAIVTLEAISHKNSIIKEWQKLRDEIIKLFIVLDVYEVNDDYNFITLHVNMNKYAELLKASEGLNIRDLEKRIVKDLMKFNKTYSKEFSELKNILNNTQLVYEDEKYILQSTNDFLGFMDIKNRKELTKPIFTMISLEVNALVKEMEIMNLFYSKDNPVAIEDATIGIAQVSVDEEMIENHPILKQDDIGSELMLSARLENIYFLENYIMSLEVIVINNEADVEPLGF